MPSACASTASGWRRAGHGTTRSGTREPRSVRSLAQRKIDGSARARSRTMPPWARTNPSSHNAGVANRATRSASAPIRPLAGRSPARPGAARRGRPAQRGRPLPLLAGRGDQGGPRPAAPPVPRGDRELGPRPEHRRGGAQRQRLPGSGGPRRRPAQVEPPRRHDDRGLSARSPPREPRRPSPPGRGPRRSPWSASTTCPARARSSTPRTTTSPAARCSCSARRGRACRTAARALVAGVLHIPQYGSTRSINAGAASAVAMVEWCRRWAGDATDGRGTALPAGRDRPHC